LDAARRSLIACVVVPDYSLRWEFRIENTGRGFAAGSDVLSVRFTVDACCQGICALPERRRLLKSGKHPSRIGISSTDVVSPG
jgi:hypothetical protein